MISSGKYRLLFVLVCGICTVQRVCGRRLLDSLPGNNENRIDDARDKTQETGARASPTRVVDFAIETKLSNNHQESYRREEHHVETNDGKQIEGFHDHGRILPSNQKWYVDWHNRQCIQGNVRLPSKELFDSAESCCSEILSWLSLDECINGNSEQEQAQEGHGEYVYEEEGAMEMMSSPKQKYRNVSNVQARQTQKCPDQYRPSSTYKALDRVTVKKVVYQCKQGPASAYCNMFSPNFERHADGTGAVVHQVVDLGWTSLGECDDSTGANADGRSSSNVDVKSKGKSTYMNQEGVYDVGTFRNSNEKHILDVTDSFSKKNKKNTSYQNRKKVTKSEDEGDQNVYGVTTFRDRWGRRGSSSSSKSGKSSKGSKYSDSSSSSSRDFYFRPSRPNKKPQPRPKWKPNKPNNRPNFRPQRPNRKPQRPNRPNNKPNRPNRPTWDDDDRYYFDDDEDDRFDYDDWYYDDDQYYDDDDDRYYDDNDFSDNDDYVILEAIDDAYIVDDKSNQNENFNERSLLVSDSFYSTTETLIKFDLIKIDDMDFEEVRLHLYLLEICRELLDVEVLVDEKWDEDRVTWRNAPQNVGPNSAQPRVPKYDRLQGDRWWEDVDVTDSILWSLNKRERYVTFRISIARGGGSKNNGGSEDECEFASKEWQNGKYPPTISVRLDRRFGNRPNRRPNTKRRPNKGRRPRPHKSNGKFRPRAGPDFTLNGRDGKESTTTLATAGQVKFMGPVDASTRSTVSSKSSKKSSKKSTKSSKSSKKSSRLRPNVSNRPNSPRPQPNIITSKRSDETDGIYTDGILLQLEGDSCIIERYLNGKNECVGEGLVCYDPDGATSGFGICTRIQEIRIEDTKVEKFAQKYQACDATFGVDACVDDDYECRVLSSFELRGGSVGVCSLAPRREGDSCDMTWYLDGKGVCEEGLTCYDPDGATFGRGTCTGVDEFADENEACNAAFGANACNGSSFECRGTNGFELGGVGTGICSLKIKARQSIRDDSSKQTFQDETNRRQWHVDYSLGSEGECVSGELAEEWEETFSSAQICCEQKLWWMSLSQCAPGEKNDA